MLRHLVLLLLVTLQLQNIRGNISDNRSHNLTDRWVSCIGEIVQRNAARVRYELNVYTLVRNASGKYFGSDLLDRLLTSLEMRTDTPFTINLALYESTHNHNQHNLALILLEDINQFENVLSHLVANNVERRGYFLILLMPHGKDIVQEDIEQEIAATFRLLWSVRIHNVVLVIEGHSPTGRIDLHTYDPYGPGCCGCSRPKLLTQCNPEGALTDARIQLYDRFERNLYGCQLRIASFERAPFLEIHQTARSSTSSLSESTIKLSGIEGNLVELLAAQLNFRVAIVQPTDGRMWGRIYPNGTAVGALGLLLNGKVHMTVGGYFPYPALLAATTQTHNYYTTELVLAVPEALASLSPLEQLLKPFQPTIWALLAMEFVLGIAVLRHSAILNFWRSFIGESIPCKTVSRRPTIRFMLLLWIIHTMLLRECYKGSLVSFLTEPTPLTDIHSLEVLVGSGYRFVMTDTVYHKVFEETKHRLEPEQVRLVSSSEQRLQLERTIQTRERLAFPFTREEIIKFNSRNRTVINYRTSDETLLTFHFAMYFKRASPIAAACDWYIRRIVATGFINRWHSENLDLRFERPTLTGSGQAEVLQMHHLQGSYLLLSTGLLLATIVFTLEKVWVRWCTRSKRAYTRYPYLHELTQYPAKQQRKRFDRI